MIKEDIQARLSRLVQLRQLQDSQRRELARCLSELNQLGAVVQAWDAQVTWSEGKKLSRLELLQRQARLEDLLRRWDASLSPDRPDWQLGVLQESRREMQQRREALRAVEQMVGHVEELLRRWQAIQTRRSLVARVEEARRELDNLRHTDEELVAAYQCRCELQDQVRARQAARDQVAAMAQQLGQVLPGVQAATWADLALHDINQLSQEAGSGLARLQQEVQSIQKKAREYGDQVTAREKTLEPMRERVVAREDQERQESQSLAHEPVELAQWGQELTHLGLPMVDGDSEPALAAFLKQLQAKHAHLQWFNDVTG